MRRPNNQQRRDRSAAGEKKESPDLIRITRRLFDIHASGNAGIRVNRTRSSVRRGCQ